MFAMQISLSAWIPLYVYSLLLMGDTSQNVWQAVSLQGVFGKSTRSGGISLLPAWRFVQAQEFQKRLKRAKDHWSNSMEFGGWVVNRCILYWRLFEQHFTSCNFCWKLTLDLNSVVGDCYTSAFGSRNSPSSKHQEGVIDRCSPPSLPTLFSLHARNCSQPPPTLRWALDV